MNIDVPITGTEHHPQGYRDWRQHQCPVDSLVLKRDPDNPYDQHAVKVMFGRVQMGWVGRTHSAKVSKMLDDGYRLEAIEMIGHNPSADPMRRIEVRLRFPDAPGQKAPASAEAKPHIVKVFGSAGHHRRDLDHLKEYGVGFVFTCRSSATRTSITMHANGEEVAWFRKHEVGAELPEELLKLADKNMLVAMVESRRPFTVSLHHGGKVPAMAISIGRGYIGHSLVGCDGTATEIRKARDHTMDAGRFLTEDEIEGSRIGINKFFTFNRTNTQPNKETTMNITNATTNLINNNKGAAAQAGYLEAGRIANNQLTKVVAKAAPMMVRGYLDTPIGKLLVANLAAVAAQQLRPQDPTLAKLTNAMTVAAYQGVIQTVDIEGWLNELMGSPEIKRALEKMSDDKSNAA